MPNPPCRLNDLTQAEMATMLEQIESKRLAREHEIRCATCGKAFRPSRLWQRFCTKRCREIYHTEYAASEIARLQRALTTAQQDNEALIHEIARLHQELVGRRSLDDVFG